MVRVVIINYKIIYKYGTANTQYKYIVYQKTTGTLRPQGRNQTTFLLESPVLVPYIFVQTDTSVTLVDNILAYS
jgi:hypothetical protein